MTVRYGRGWCDSVHAAGSKLDLEQGRTMRKMGLADHSLSGRRDMARGDLSSSAFIFYSKFSNKVAQADDNDRTTPGEEVGTRRSSAIGQGCFLRLVLVLRPSLRAS